MRRESNLDEVLATIDSMLSWMNGVNGIVREVALRSDVYKKAVERFGSNPT